MEIVIEPEGPPEPEPGSPEWEYVAEPIDDVSYIVFLLGVVTDTTTTSRTKT